MFHLQNLFFLMGGNGESQSDGNLFSSPLILFVIMIGIFYIFLILPQQRKAKKDQEMRTQLKEGDKIITTGGIVGTIEKVKDNTIIVRSGKNTSLEFVKEAIVRKIEKTEDVKGENQ